MSARLLELRVGRARRIESPEGSWRSAIHKERVPGPLWLSSTGLAGDEVGNTQVHGGPEQAVLAYASEHYARWAAEGFSGDFGGFGENLLLEGLEDDRACIGDRFALGEALLEVASPRVPCNTLVRRHGRADIMAQVFRQARGGWYCRVLREGFIQAGQELELLARPNPEWSVARVLQVRWKPAEHREEAQALAALEGLDPAWRAKLAAASA